MTLPGNEVRSKSPDGVDYERNIQYATRFVNPVIEPEESGPADPVVSSVPSEQTSGEGTTSGPQEDRDMH